MCVSHFYKHLFVYTLFSIHNHILPYICNVFLRSIQQKVSLFGNYNQTHVRLGNCSSSRSNKIRRHQRVPGDFAYHIYTLLPVTLLSVYHELWILSTRFAISRNAVDQLSIVSWYFSLVPGLNWSKHPGKSFPFTVDFFSCTKSEG